jgi:hypothetical protein
VSGKEDKTEICFGDGEFGDWGPVVGESWIAGRGEIVVCTYSSGLG